MSALTDDLKELYLSWLRERISLKEVNGAIEITTPLTDRHNDYLQIYVTDQGSDRFRLTDAGYILSDLEMGGIDIFKSPKRREIFDTVLNGYGVHLSKSNELFAEATLSTFPQKKHMLLQAMMTVNDMFMTSRSNVASVFVEDVSMFLDQHDIRFTPGIAFMGKTGFTHRFDFVIPKSKSAPERVIKSANSLNKQSTSILLFSWKDAQEHRGIESKLYVFLNDAAKPVSKDVLSAISQYDASPVPWSQRYDHLPELTA